MAKFQVGEQYQYVEDLAADCDRQLNKDFGVYDGMILTVAEVSGGGKGFYVQFDDSPRFYICDYEVVPCSSKTKADCL